MLRALLIYLSQADWARRFVTRFSLARRTALRFVAGETLDEALVAVTDLNAAGMLVTLDLLGEHTHNAEVARQATDRICAALDAIAASQAQSTLSIKLTQIGLKLDPALCAANLQRILETAQRYGNFVRVDMEDSPVTDVTLDLVRRMRDQGFNNVGAVIQSYLYRSDEDIAALLKEGIRIRMVKGAYMEPHSVAYPRKADADASFDRLTAAILEASRDWSADAPPNSGWPPLAAVGSHDEARIDFAKTRTAELGLPKSALEIQMLYGIRRELQTQLVEEGYPVRIYVPFGTEWYPYFMRRLAERPANLWFFLSNLIRS
jgi:proline dehydrogenase